MSKDPHKPAMDFDEEIKLLEEKLCQKYPLVTSDKLYSAIKEFIRAKEISKWFDRIAGVKADGVAPITLSPVNPLIDKAHIIDDKGVL